MAAALLVETKSLVSTASVMGMFGSVVAESSTAVSALPRKKRENDKTKSRNAESFTALILVNDIRQFKPSPGGSVTKTFQNCRRRPEESLIPFQFEPRYLVSYEGLKELPPAVN